MVKMKTKRHKNLEKCITESFKSTVKAYSNKNQEIFEEPRQWGQFGITHRRNGEIVVGGFRNIKDLGNLKNSQNLEFLNDYEAQLSWDGNGETPPTLVFYGYRTKNSFVPGRPWTNVALEEMNLVDVFRENFNANINN